MASNPCSRSTSYATAHDETPIPSSSHTLSCSQLLHVRQGVGANVSSVTDQLYTPPQIVQIPMSISSSSSFQSSSTSTLLASVRSSDSTTANFGSCEASSTARQNPGSDLTNSELAVIRWDSKQGQKRYLEILADICREMNGKNDFCNKTSTGEKITCETFYDLKKLSPELVQRCIVMLLVHFGFMAESETCRGLPKEDWKPLQGVYFARAGMKAPKTNFTTDSLHHKIMGIFFRNSDSSNNYYHYSALSCPELHPKKTRAALAYFTQFCIFSTELRNKLKKTWEAQACEAERLEELETREEELRALIAEEEALEERLKSEVQAEKRRIDEGDVESEPVPENIDDTIHQAKETLKDLQARSHSIRLSSQSVQTGRSLLNSTTGTVHQHKRRSELPGQSGSRSFSQHTTDTEQASKELSAKIAQTRADNLEIEQTLERCLELKSELMKLEAKKCEVKNSKEFEKVSLDTVKALIVKALRLEKDLEDNRRHHRLQMEALRSRVARKEKQLMYEKEKAKKIDQMLKTLPVDMNNNTVEQNSEVVEVLPSDY